jgi:hypothetical protein
MRCLTNARRNTSACAMSQLGHDLPVRQRRTRGRSSPNSCRSGCIAKIFRLVPQPVAVERDQLREVILGRPVVSPLARAGRRYL